MEGWLAAELAGLDPEDRWYVGRPLLVNENDYELRLNNGDTGVVVSLGTAASPPPSPAARRRSSTAPAGSARSTPSTR